MERLHRLGLSNMRARGGHELTHGVPTTFAQWEQATCGHVTTERSPIMDRRNSLIEMLQLFLCVVVILCCIVTARMDREDRHSMANASTVSIEE